MRGEKQRRPDKIENELNDEQHNGGPAHPGSPRMQDHGDGKTDEKVKQRPRCGEYPSRRHNVRFRQSCEPTVTVTASRYPARRDAKQQDQWDGKQRPTQIGHSELSPGRNLIHRTCSPTWSEEHTSALQSLMRT